MNLTELKAVVDRLPSAELAELSGYILKQDQAAWDREIDADSAPGGRLSEVLEEVRAEIRCDRLEDMQ